MNRIAALGTALAAACLSVSSPSMAALADFSPSSDTVLAPTDAGFPDFASFFIGAPVTVSFQPPTASAPGEIRLHSTGVMEILGTLDATGCSLALSSDSAIRIGGIVRADTLSVAAASINLWGTLELAAPGGNIAIYGGGPTIGSTAAGSLSSSGAGVTLYSGVRSAGSGGAGSLTISSGSGSFGPKAVPEPGTPLLLSLGLMGLAVAAHRRRPSETIPAAGSGTFPA